jgi:serine/threonine-protein kinase
VLGLSWRDAADYVAWRNRRAEAAGEPWRYELPSTEELEKAARGVDGRLFPWGNRFDATLTVGINRKASWLLDVAGGFEPRDESVYQVQDLAGSREEWTRTFQSNTDTAQLCYKLGGSWGGGAETAFHSASRGFAGVDRPGSTQGFRLVARRR